MILVNGKSIRFDHLNNDGDDISVYPLFESLDISDVQHLRAKPLRNPMFIADVHLEKLARYLRMMGFDVLYENNFEDDEIIRISLAEKRAILTKDLGILKRNEVTHGYWVRNSIVKEQVVEIMKRFDLIKLIIEFTRCIECNTILKSISKQEIIDEFPPKVTKSQTEFSRCPSCKKLYWKGTHHQRMLSFIKTIKSIEY